MSRRQSMFDVAALLDDTIERGEVIGRLAEKSLAELFLDHRRVCKSLQTCKSRVGHEALLAAKTRLEYLIAKSRGEPFAKSISFNPLEPHAMNAESSYYSPYRLLGDGSYAPHSTEHWMQQEPSMFLDGEFGGRRIGVGTTHSEAMRRDGYSEVDRFYFAAGVFKSELYASVDELVKAIPAAPPSGNGPGKKGLPVGTVHTWNGMQFQKQADGQWTPVTQGKGPHPIEQDAATKQKKLQQILDARKKGVAKEPSFEDRARVATAKHKEISTKEGELEKRDRDAATRDHDHREKDLTDRQAKLDEHEKALTEHSKRLEASNKKAPLEHQFVSPEALQALEKKVAKREPGKGQHVDLTKAELAHTLKNGKFSLISAGKNPNHPEDSQLDDAAIKERNDVLEKELKDAGYAYTRVKGHYGGEEDSFLVMVHQADKPHMVALGKKLNQDSVIYAEGGKQEMIYTTGDKAGQKHVGEGFEEKPDAEDYYSEMETTDGGVVKFSLNFDWDNPKSADDAKPKEDRAKKLRTSQDMIKETKMHPSTKHQHTDADGSYNDERSELHEQIFDKYLSHVPEAEGQPVAILIGGGSGSGKSAAMQAARELHGLGDYVHIDADEIKKDIPEYAALTRHGDEGAAAHAHDESSDLTSELIRRSMDQNKSFVYDSTMKNAGKFEKLIASLKEAGFHVHISYADAPKELAMERATERAKKTGRKVPESIIHESHDGSRKALSQIHHLADSVVVHDTTVGPPPKTVYERNGEMKHFDSDWHEKSKERGLVMKSDGAKKKGKIKHHPGVEKIEKMISESTAPYDVNLSPVVDEGVTHDQYPRKKTKEAKK